MKNSLFPSVREAVLVIVITAFFLILTAVCIGLRPEHFLMAGVFLVLFFAGQTTRKLAVALLPFFIFGISYDWMRVYPNYQVNPIDVKGLYEAEKSLFGLSVDGAVLIPCEYFALNHCPVADFFAGIFYLCWVPVPIAFGLWLYLKGDRKVYLRFAMVFLLVNLIGFAGYYIHPAAPPWYAMNYGFEPILDTPGNVAGLGRFDELLGCSIFNSIYGRNANVFAAVPSLHAAYMVVALAYAVMDRSKKWLIALFAVIMVGIWWTAVYSGHHYLIDVMLGISCALLGIFVFEKGLMKWGAFGTLHETDFTLQPQTFGTGTHVTHHQRTYQRNECNDGAPQIALQHQVIEDAEQCHELAVTVEYGVVERTESRTHFTHACHTSVHHVKQPGNKKEKHR